MNFLYVVENKNIRKDIYLNMSKKLPILYQRSSTNKIKVWNIDVQNIEGKPKLIIEHGIKGGQLIQDIREVELKQHKYKTDDSLYEQAISEAQSRWNKKKDREGYSENIEEENTSFISPMLAYKYQDRYKDIIFPAYAQPKLNGNRCIVGMNGKQPYYQSRKGVLWETLSHLNSDITKIYKIIGNPLDGEIFHPEMDIQDIGALIKKYHGPDNPVGEWITGDLEYWIYDYIDVNKNFLERDTRLEDAFLELDAEFNDEKKLYRLGKVCLIPCYACQSDTDIRETHKNFTAQNYEGTMIRNNVPYVIGHRTKHLQKLKDWLDNEYTIVGGYEGTGREKGCCVFTLETNEGKRFNCRPVGTVEQRKKYLRDIQLLINKKANVRYQEITADGVPFHARVMYIRDID